MVSFKKITSSVICGKTKAINAIRLDKPIEYNGNPNPFENGREIYGQDYCKFCEKWYDEDAFLPYVQPALRRAGLKDVQFERLPSKRTKTLKIYSNEQK